MGWIDALYFCVITLTTVGYGDLLPQTPIGLVGLGPLAAFIGYVARHAQENVQESGVLPRLCHKVKPGESDEP